MTAYLALMIALVAWASASGEWLGFSSEFLTVRVQGWFYLVPIVWLLLTVELYDIHRAAKVRDTVRIIATAGMIALGLYGVIYLAVPTPGSLPRLGIGLFLIAVSILSLVWRLIYIRIFTAPAFMRRVLVVGAGRAGDSLLKVLRDLEPAPFAVLGVIDDDPAKLNTELHGYPVVAGSADLPKVIAAEQVTDIIVAISGEMQGEMFEALLEMQEKGIEIGRMQSVYEDILGQVPIFHLEADWILRSFVEQTRVNSGYDLAKRMLDIVGGLVGVLGMLLVLPFVLIANLFESGWPVFYSQVRSGRGDQPYNVLKFRTMAQDAEKDGIPQWTAENDERVTRVGLFLRKTHLDELPQFINVLKGEMSLVGPRPERPELISLFQEHVPFYRARLLVKPGITGWAQLHQIYASNVEETNVKLEYDLYYIKHRSLLLDLLVLLRTPAMMIGLRGR